MKIILKSLFVFCFFKYFTDIWYWTSITFSKKCSNSCIIVCQSFLHWEEQVLLYLHTANKAQRGKQIALQRSFFPLSETKHSAHIWLHSANFGKRLLPVVQQPKLPVSSLFTLASVYCWLSQLSAKRWLFGSSLACFLCIRYFTLWCSHYDGPKPQRCPIEEFKHTKHQDRLYWLKHILLIFSVRPCWDGIQQQQKKRFYRIFAQLMCVGFHCM